MAEFAPLERLSLVLPAGEGADFGDFPLEGSVILSGRVSVVGGGPVAGAEIFKEQTATSSPFLFIMPGIERTPVAVTADDGTFLINTLSAGPWKLRVDSKTHPERTFEGRTDRPGDQRAGLEFQLEPGGAIRGKVTGFPQGGLEGLVVRATPKSQGRSFGPQRNWREVSVTSDGNFALEGCEMDKEYSLQGRLASDTAARPWGGEAKTRTKEVTASAGQRGVVLAWTGTTGVRFQIVSPAGEPIEDFSVRYGQGFLRDFAVEGETVRHHPGGLVSLEELSIGGFGQSGDFKVLVDAAGFESFEQVVALAKGSIVDAGRFQLESAAMVTVRVVDDATGQPVEGADVSLSLGGEGMAGVAIGGGGSRFFSGDNTGKQRSAKSGADGLAKLSSFEGQTGRLEVTEDEHTAWTLEMLSMPAGQSQELEARLGRGGTVAVTVLDAFGKPVAGAQVEMRPAGAGLAGDDPSQGFRRARVMGGTPQGITDTSGVALFEHLTPGSHEFHLAENVGVGAAMVFFAGVPEDEAEVWPSVEVTEGGYSELELRETPRSTLSGVVREGGTPLAGASLRLDAKSESNSSGGMRGMLFFGGTGGKGTGTTDGRGAFVLEGVEPGSYVLTVNHATRTMAYEVDVELAAGANQKDLDLSIAVIEGRVTDGEGNPLAGVKVTVEGGSPAQRFGAIMIHGSDGGSTITVGGDDVDPSTTDADGRYRLRGVAVDEDLRVVAKLGGSAPAETELFLVADGQVKRGVNLEMQPAGKVQVTLGGFVENQFVMVTGRYLEGDGADPVNEFAESGEVTLQGLRSGKWDIRVERLGPDSEDGEIEPQTVIVTAGKTEPLFFQL